MFNIQHGIKVHQIYKIDDVTSFKT